ncbi:MAG: hypothetical protein Q9162_003188 [Coniocarpon cinnabarinum]
MPFQDSIKLEDKLLQIIDFGPFLWQDASSDERIRIGKEIYRAFREYGFLYLKNYGMPFENVETAFVESAAFFGLSLEAKNALAWDRPESNRGYSCMGQEKVTNVLDKDGIADLRASNPDLKESFEIGREGVPDMPNQWPSAETSELHPAEFRDHMIQFFSSCKKLHMHILRAIAVGLGIDECWFDEYTNVGDNTLRLLHYPAVERSVFERNQGQVRAGAHTDYGSITLLFQDDRGGLQVQHPDGVTWVNAKPLPGTIIVNAGDLLARWANDTIKSTHHRVVEPPLDTAPAGHRVDGAPQEDVYPPRYSIAYFCNPDFDKFIDVVPGTLEGKPKKYEGINSGDYLVQRLAATY